MTNAARSKSFAPGPSGSKVPFTEVALSDGEPAVRLYDTSGPGSDPAVGLPPLRLPWITGRGDVEAYAGRSPAARDDGRAAARSGEAPAEFTGERRAPLRARAGSRALRPPG